MKSRCRSIPALLLLFAALLPCGCTYTQSSFSSSNLPQTTPLRTFTAADEEEAQFLKLTGVDSTQTLPDDKREKLKEFYITRGRRYLSEDNTVAAYTEFKKALDLDPSSTEARTYLDSIEKGTVDESLLAVREEAVPTLPEYRINLNDTLEISVWQYRELIREVKVRPDGRISFPLVGDMWAYKRTPNELSTQLAAKLSEYVRDPKVAVIVKKFAGQRVVVMGKVKKPGVYKLKPTDRLLDAIAKGGGFAKEARKVNVLLVRYWKRATPEVTVIDTKAMLDGGNVESLVNNLPLHHMDLVYVPRTRWSKLQDFIQKTIQPITTSLNSSAFFLTEIEALPKPQTGGTTTQ